MKNSHESKRSLFFSAIQAQSVWILTAVLLILLFCAIAYSMEDPDSVTFPLSLCALYVSAMTGGIASVRLSGDGIMSGVLSGIITALLVVLISLLPLPISGTELPMSIVYLGLVIPASMIGSVLGHKRKDKPKSKRKKMLR